MGPLFEGRKIHGTLGQHHFTASLTRSPTATKEPSASLIWRGLDSDADGAPDVLEGGDSDGNGVPDECEPNVIGAVVANGLPLSARSTAQLLALLTIADDTAGTGRILPWRRLVWHARQLESEGVGPFGNSPGRTTITLEIPEDVPVDGYLNFGPTPDQPEDHYYEFLYDGTTGAEIFRDRIVLHFVDGARGDHDLEVNGEIVTAGGPLILPELLYFPFNSFAPGIFTGYAVSNFSDVPAVVQFDALDSSGELSPGLQNPAFFGIPSSSQVARLAGEIFETPADEISIGWARAKSTSRDVGSFFQFGAAGRLDGSVAIRDTTEELWFTRVFEGPTAYRGRRATTLLNVVNPNATAVEIALELLLPESGLGSTGRPLLVDDPVQKRVIPAGGSLALTVSELFGADLETSSALVHVQALSAAGTPCGGEGTLDSCGLIGFELIEIPDPGTVIGLNAARPSQSSVLYSAQLASVASSIFTNLKLANLSGEMRNVVLTPVSSEGGELADPISISLRPGETLERDASDLFTFGGAAVGSLEVQADGDGMVADVVFGDPNRANFAAALPLQARGAVEAVFSQVANVAGFFTGLAFFNPELEDALVSVQVYAADGELSGSTQFEIPAGQRLSQTVDQLVEDTSGQAGGYIRVRSDVPIIAQQLFGTSNLSLLSVVPPRVIR